LARLVGVERIDRDAGVFKGGIVQFVLRELALPNNTLSILVCRSTARVSAFLTWISPKMGCGLVMSSGLAIVDVLLCTLLRHNRPACQCLGDEWHVQTFRFGLDAYPMK
jgi:hypothetical protein